MKNLYPHSHSRVTIYSPQRGHMDTPRYRVTGRCRTCQKRWSVQLVRARRRRAFCSTSCARQWHARRLDRVAIFWSRVNKTKTCWLWMGSRWNVGYGRYKINQVEIPAHRYAWTLIHGTIPHGLGVLHRCDVKLCVNPAHLFLGTTHDNMQDRQQKGGYASIQGIHHPKARLTEAQVQLIRSSPPRSDCRLARKFDVSSTAIRYARIGLTWKPLNPSS